MSKLRYLTPVNPDRWAATRNWKAAFDHRVIDLLAPLDAVNVLVDCCNRRVLANHNAAHHQQRYFNQLPDVKLIVLLIDERPEEVTICVATSSMVRSSPASGLDEVVISCASKPAGD